MSVYDEIGRRIIYLRKQKSLTQENLALECDISVSYLRLIEHAKANPTGKELLKLANVLECDVHILVASSLPVTEARVFHNNYMYPICPHCQITLDRKFQSFCD